jgi:hypothetical protein
MTIHIECHRCKKKYKTPNKLEGRQFRCSQCGEVLDVVELLPIVEPEPQAPAPQVVAPQSPPAAPVFPQAAPAQGVYSAYQSPFPPSGSGFEPEHDRPKKKKKRRWSSSGDVEIPWAALGITLLLVVGVVFAASYMSPGVGAVLSLIVMGICALTSLACGIWLLVIAFQEDVLCGILMLIPIVGPFYSLYYIITRWGECKAPFLLNLSSVALLYATICAGTVAIGLNGRGGSSEPEPFGPPSGWIS